MRRILLAAALAMSSLVGIVSPARADITYLVDATFNDGTTVTGDFTTNVYGYLSSWDLTTLTGSISSYHYQSDEPGNTFLTSCTVRGPCFDWGRPGYEGGLQLAFADPLGSYGPDPILVGLGGPSWENFSYSPAGAPIRYVVSGEVTGVPEPATWALLLAGFGAVGFRARPDRVESRDRKGLAQN